MSNKDLYNRKVIELKAIEEEISELMEKRLKISDAIRNNLSLAKTLIKELSELKADK